MLRMFAKLLIEMLTNREDFVDFDNLEIDPEIKCLLYECYHAKDKTDMREQDRYEAEVNRFIQKVGEKSFHEEKLKKDRDEFQMSIAEGKNKAEEEKKSVRTIKRKQDIPKPNVKNFDEEN
jgi:hypothetical protein